MSLHKTPLHSRHLSASAHMGPFAGWEMPIHYGSQIEEHLQVRRAAGVFDVSHMVVADLHGHDCTVFLQTLLANDVAKLDEDGTALYSCMLNENGGVIDDLIVYRCAADHYRLVLNAGTATNDLEWIAEQSKNLAITIRRRNELAILAVQGPEARQIVAGLVGRESTLLNLPRFRSVTVDDLFIARTGYTGEDGFEVILPADQALQLWDQLLAAKVVPVGLGARDTLRLEAGLCLYGQDLDIHTTPLDSGLAWTIAWQPESRDFTGRSALTARSLQTNALFTGLLLEDKGVLRSGMTLLQSERVIGITTSGGFSPTLQRSIAFTRIDAAYVEGLNTAPLFVDIRGKQKSVRLVPLPFIKNGKITFKI